MTRQRRWLLAMLAVVLIGAATPVALVLLPCESHVVVLLNATRWTAQVTLQIEISQRYTVWSGTVEPYEPPLRVSIAAPNLEGSYLVTVHFPETSQSISEPPFGYTTPFISEVEFLLIRDEDIVHALWNDPPLTEEPTGLWSSLWDAASYLRRRISCLDGS